MDDRRLILSIRELPRPKGEGAFCYRFSDKCDSGVIGYLKLIDADKGEVERVFLAGLDKILDRERASKSTIAQWLASVEMENMQPWVKILLAKVIKEWSGIGV